MARPSWLVDSNRIATKIKSASGSSNPGNVQWESNPTKACPNCKYIIDNSDVVQAWPGLPQGVKFDPSDPEIIWHLLAKVRYGGLRPHPFIDEFIPTVGEDDGICYTHPQNLPGAKQDGSVFHLFHRAIKAYNTGTRKRRKILGDDFGDVRWHKTGRTKPVALDGVHKGCKKIMVLYASIGRGGKSEKTSWVMHQYHLGTEEDEKEGEYIISKIFLQQQQIKPGDKNEIDVVEVVEPLAVKVDLVTPEPPRHERLCGLDALQGAAKGNMTPQHAVEYTVDCEAQETENPNYPEEHIEEETAVDPMVDDGHPPQSQEDPKWWDSESQYLLDSQQLVEGLSLCDEFLQSQSPNRDGNSKDEPSKNKPRLADYAKLGHEDLKKDLEECQNLLDSETATNLDLLLDKPADFRLSQLEFGSQESYIAWGGNKVI